MSAKVEGSVGDASKDKDHGEKNADIHSVVGRLEVQAIQYIATALGAREIGHSAFDMLHRLPLVDQEHCTKNRSNTIKIFHFHYKKRKKN